MVGLGMVKQPVEDLTVAKLRDIFPGKKATITQETVDLINETQKNPEFDGHKMIDNMMSLQNVMMKNSGSMVDFINAVKFCAFLEVDNKYIEAYKNTFYDRDFVKLRAGAAAGSKEYKELTSAASRYRKSPMVVDILTQANVPLYLMFQGTTYEAVNVLADEMTSARHSKDRIAAAKAILEHVKPPENVKVELDIGVSGGSALEDLNAQLEAVAGNQMKLLENGAMSIGEMGAMKPKDEDAIDVEVDE